MNITNNALRQFYPMFRPLYRPILRSALFRKAGILPFDGFFARKKSGARLSKFHPRHPFAAERGAPAVMGLQYDPDNPFGHEPELAHLIDSLVPDDGVFLDVGSNGGYFSIYLATRPHFKGHVHAFEPITFEAVQRTVDLLQCGKEVTCHPMAVSDECGTAQMDVGTIPGRASIRDQAPEQGITVPRITLDSLNLGKVDFLKVDVEGHEAQALKGAKALIQGNKPYIFLESSLSNTDKDKVFEPLRFLTDCGYRLYLPAWLQSNGTFRVGIGHDYTRDIFALVPFTLQDRLTFPGHEINIFACHPSREASLGGLYPDKTKLSKLSPPLTQVK